MGNGRVLVVEDEADVGAMLVGMLEQAKYSVTHALTGEEGLTIAANTNIDVVITDLRMQPMDGMAFLEEMKVRAPEIPVIMLTGHGTVADAVQAMKLGACDFLLKGTDNADIVQTVDRAIARKPQVSSLTHTKVAGLIIRSDVMKACFEDVQKAAQSKANVLLMGETGTGKSACARAIHSLSSRKDQPIVEINASTIPENLLESELFGYEKGAFSGATMRKPGRVELADGGTFFLDEIGDVSAALQPKLLRLLQEKAFERLGGTRTEKVDVRFITATKRDLRAMVQEKAFREDLFYRINVIPIIVPPLRERRDDIEPLARHFAKVAAEVDERPQITFAPGAIEKLIEHDWPGNVRELENVIERLVVFTDGKAEASDVEREIRRLGGPISGPSSSRGGSLDAKRADAEKDAILDALDRAKNNRSKAARLLGVSRRTLYNKLEEYGIK